MRRITWVWQGQVARVIEELAARQRELGLPTEGDAVTHPRHLVRESQTYLQNQQSRMNCPQYRRLGLLINSRHIESTMMFAPGVSV